jgi:hypothetical protein
MPYSELGQIVPSLRGSPWQVPMVKGMIVTSLSDYNDYKTKQIQKHKMHKQKG